MGQFIYLGEVSHVQLTLLKSYCKRVLFPIILKVKTEREPKHREWPFQKETSCHFFFFKSFSESSKRCKTLTNSSFLE